MTLKMTIERDAEEIGHQNTKHAMRDIEQMSLCTMSSITFTAVASVVLSHRRKFLPRKLTSAKQPHGTSGHQEF